MQLGPTATRAFRCQVRVLMLALFAGATALWGQTVPQRPAFSMDDEFNRESAPTDTGGIAKYSMDLIRLLIPPGADESGIAPFAERLTRAEKAARTGRGKLVPEANVVKAFNELLAKVGAPTSLKADEAQMASFRRHAASIKAFSGLYTEDRNGPNCNPGEAVFLIYLLISGNGALHEGNLDAALAHTHSEGQQPRRSYGVVALEGAGSNAEELLSAYASHHERNATLAIFNQLATSLSF